MLVSLLSGRNVLLWCARRRQKQRCKRGNLSKCPQISANVVICQISIIGLVDTKTLSPLFGGLVQPFLIFLTLKMRALAESGSLDDEAVWDRFSFSVVSLCRSSHHVAFSVSPFSWGILLISLWTAFSHLKRQEQVWCEFNAAAKKRAATRRSGTCQNTFLL